MLEQLQKKCVMHSSLNAIDCYHKHNVHLEVRPWLPSGNSYSEISSGKLLVQDVFVYNIHGGNDINVVWICVNVWYIYIYKIIIQSDM